MEKKDCVYILECNDGTLYTGWTNDIDKRFKAHNDGKGAKYTKGRRPLKLVYLEELETKSEALKRENEIKKNLMIRRKRGKKRVKVKMNKSV